MEAETQDAKNRLDTQQCFAYPKQSFTITPMRFSFRTLAPLFIAPFFTHCGSGTAPKTNAVTGPFDGRGNYIEDWVDQPDKWYRPSTTGDKPKQKPFFAKKETPGPKPEPEIAVVQPPREIANEQPRPEVSQPKPTPKPVVAKPKPKPKPKVVRYTVKKGDSLSKIASKNGVSLSALRRANGISGDLIRPGQSLTIPR